MQRLFFALWPGDAVRAAIFQATQTVFGVHDPQAQQRYHLTLLFLGHLASDNRVLAERVAATVSCGPFALTLDRAGSFGKALWLGPSTVPAELALLGGRLREAARNMRLPHDDRPLTPHVTCLRDAARQPKPGPIAPIAWPVQDFVLVESVSGAQPPYRVLKRWPLATRAPGQ